MPNTALPLNAWNATDLLAAYRSKELSPVEVARAVLSHIEVCDPQLCASYLFQPEKALIQARASEARWLRGAPCGLLDGVPVTIKENIATRGDPTPLGTLATQALPATADAPPAARLCEAGAVMVC